MWQQFRDLLGIQTSSDSLNVPEMVLRAVIIYLFTLALVRLGSKRFLSEATAFDVVIGIMLGSVMSRAITGSTSFFPTIAAGATLIATHWLLTMLSLHSDWLGQWIKGERVLLIEDGKIQDTGMRRAGVSRRDLEQAIRINTNHTDPAKIRLAHLERNGDISIVAAKGEPKVLEVQVENGVQTVRIELD